MKKVIIFCSVLILTSCVQEPNYPKVEEQQKISVRNCDECKKFTDKQFAKMATGAYFQLDGAGMGTPLNNCLTISVIKNMSKRDIKLISICVEIKSKSKYNATPNYLIQNEPDNFYWVAVECGQPKKLLEQSAKKQCL